MKEKLEKVILSKKKEITKTKGGQLLIEKAFANGEMRVELEAFRNVFFRKKMFVSQTSNVLDGLQY